MIALSTNTTEIPINVVASWADIINKYGFMILFSAVALFIILYVLLGYEKRNARKQESELGIANKEREASIEQNKKMFDLVTVTQAQQVVQLQEMTDSLREMHHSIKNGEEKLNAAESSFQRIRDSIISNSDENNDNIIKVLSEILEYVKKSEICNKEILEKVDILEKSLQSMNK